MSIEKKTLTDIKSNLYSSFMHNFLIETGIPIELYAGDLTKTILDVTANAMYELYTEIYNIYDSVDFNTAIGSELDRAAYVFGITRKDAQPSQGLVTLTFNPVYTSTSIVNPGDIQVIDSDGGMYTNIDSTTLDTISTSYSLFFDSGKTGNITNIMSNSITTVSSFAGVDLSVFDINVTNNSFYGGSDKESDTKFRARIKQTIDSLGNGSLGYFTNLINSFQSSKYTISGIPKRVLSSNITENFNSPYSTASVFVGEEILDNTSSNYFISETITSTVVNTASVINITQIPINTIYTSSFKLNYLDSSPPLVVRTYDFNFNNNNQTSSNGLLWQPVQQWDIMINKATGEILANPDTSTCFTFDSNGLPIIPGIFPSGSQLILNLSYYSNIYNELQQTINDTNLKVIGSEVLIVPVITVTPGFIIKIQMQPTILYADYKEKIKQSIQLFFSTLIPGKSLYMSELSGEIYNVLGNAIIKDILYTDLDNNPITVVTNNDKNSKLIYSSGILIIENV